MIQVHAGQRTANLLVSFMKVIRVKTSAQGLLEVSVLSCTGVLEVLWIPLEWDNHFCVLNAKSLSEQQIFRVWGSKEEEELLLVLFMFHLTFLFLSSQLVICLTPLQGESSSVVSCNI